MKRINLFSVTLLVICLSSSVFAQPRDTTSDLTKELFDGLSADEEPSQLLAKYGGLAVFQQIKIDGIECTALQHAVIFKRASWVASLQRMGADPNEVFPDGCYELGRRPLELGLNWDASDVAAALLEAGVNPDEIFRSGDHEGKTPLCLASCTVTAASSIRLVRAGAAMDDAEWIKSKFASQEVIIHLLLGGTEFEDAFSKLLSDRNPASFATLVSSLVYALSQGYLEQAASVLEAFKRSGESDLILEGLCEAIVYYRVLSNAKILTLVVEKLPWESGIIRSTRISKVLGDALLNAVRNDQAEAIEILLNVGSPIAQARSFLGPLQRRMTPQRADLWKRLQDWPVAEPPARDSLWFVLPADIRRMLPPYYYTRGPSAAAAAML